MNQSAKILGGAYVLGIWAYGLWHVWENWEGSTHIGTLAGAGFARAIAWPVWVALSLKEPWPSPRDHQPAPRHYF